MTAKRIAVTGINGFIGFNTALALRQVNVEVIGLSRGASDSVLAEVLDSVDCIIHAAGVNRSEQESEFEDGNVKFTERIVSTLYGLKNRPKVIFMSTIQAGSSTPYGRTKLIAENLLLEMSRKRDIPLRILRLPNVFGKWSKPNYNSFLATMCWKIQRGLAYSIDDDAKSLRLLYIDNLTEHIIKLIDVEFQPNAVIERIDDCEDRTLRYIESRLLYFQKLKSGDAPNFIDEFDKELFATFKYFSPNFELSSTLGGNHDDRGYFAEVFRTENSGQVSVLVCNPGSSRGHHFHNTKVEEFIYISGLGQFEAENLKTNEKLTWNLGKDKSERIFALPGWLHSVYNTGNEPLVLIVWASGIHDPGNPDTYFRRLNE